MRLDLCEFLTAELDRGCRGGSEVGAKSWEQPSHLFPCAHVPHFWNIYPGGDPFARACLVRCYTTPRVFAGRTEGQLAGLYGEGLCVPLRNADAPYIELSSYLVGTTGYHTWDVLLFGCFSVCLHFPICLDKAHLHSTVTTRALFSFSSILILLTLRSP